MSDPTARGGQRLRHDGGVTLVVMALSITAIVMIAALAIDGGRAYANRRQMQNAADVAAVTGTRYLAENKFRPSPPATVAQLVQTVKDQSGFNKSDQTADQLDCWLVSSGTTPARLPLGGPIDICDHPNTAWNVVVSTSTAGVEVRTARNQESFLASVANIDTFNARAAATATMQPLTGTGSAPFIVCGAPEPIGYGIVDGGTILPGAIGQMYPLQAGQSGTGNGGGGNGNGNNNGKDPALRNCSAGAAFDGTGPTPDDPYKIPMLNAWLSGGNGNGFSNDTLNQLVGGDNCSSASNNGANGCRVVLPIASTGEGNGRKDVKLWIVAFGVFQVYGNGTGNTPPECKIFGHPNPKYCGRLLGAAEVAQGTGGTGDVVNGNPYLIKLVPNPNT